MRRLQAGRFLRRLRVEPLEDRRLLTAAVWNLGLQGAFSQNWSDIDLITANNNWNNVPSVMGYRGDGLTATAGVDPQTVLGPGTFVVDVAANDTAPPAANSGAAEFNFGGDNVVALAGDATADAPHLVFYLNSTGRQDVSISYILSDIDLSTRNSVQPFALQYRLASSGDFTNVPQAFVADASELNPTIVFEAIVGPVSFPAWSNQPHLELRIITTNAVNASGAATNDEWIGVDDIVIISTAIPVNTAPTATPQSLSTPEDGSLNGVLTGADAESQPLTFAVTTLPQHGTITEINASTGEFTYEPAGNFNGGDSFQFTASDGSLTSAPATASINVTPVNDNPTLSAPLQSTTLEGSVSHGFFVASDIDGDPLAASASLGTVTVVDAAAGHYMWSLLLADGPLADPVEVTFTVSDGQGGSATNSLALVIDNIGPVVEAGNDGVARPGAKLDRLVNFTDPGADAPWTVAIDWDGDATFDETFEALERNVHLAGLSMWTYGEAALGQTFLVTVRVDDGDGGVGEDTFVVAVTYAADFDGDGAVGTEDLGTWSTYFGSNDNALPANGDSNNDGDVDGADFLTWQRQLGSSLAGELPVEGLASQRTPILRNGCWVEAPVAERFAKQPMIEQFAPTLDRAPKVSVAAPPNLILAPSNSTAVQPLSTPRHDDREEAADEIFEEWPIDFGRSRQAESTHDDS